MPLTTGAVPLRARGCNRGELVGKLPAPKAFVLLSSGNCCGAGPTDAILDVDVTDDDDDDDESLPNTPCQPRASALPTPPSLRKKLPAPPGLSLLCDPVGDPTRVANGGSGMFDALNRCIIARSSSALRNTLRCSATPLLNRL